MDNDLYAAFAQKAINGINSSNNKIGYKANTWLAR